MFVLPHCATDATVSTALSTGAAARAGSCLFQAGVDYGTGERDHFTGLRTKEECCAACLARPTCAVATFDSLSGYCWFKGKAARDRPPKRASNHLVSCLTERAQEVVQPARAHRGAKMRPRAASNRNTPCPPRAGAVRVGGSLCDMRFGDMRCPISAPAQSGLPKRHISKASNSNVTLDARIIAYTIAGGDWSQYIPLQLSAWRQAGMAILVVAAIDQRAHDLACQHATHAVHTPLPKNGSKTAIGYLKFMLAAALASLGPQLFMEMDVFLMRSPVTLVAHAPANAILCWGHSDNPHMFNIGSWYTAGGRDVVYFFTQMANVMLENNATRYPALWNMAGSGNVWDQWAFNCVARCWSAAPNSRTACNNNCVDFDVLGHRDLKFLLGDSRDVYASADFDLFGLPLPRQRFAAHTMVHVLSSRIFDPSAAKVTAARVLGAWPDSNKYYTSQKTRYLALRSPGNGVDYVPLDWPQTKRGTDGYEWPHKLQGYFIFAVALARHLGRVLTLPTFSSKTTDVCIGESLVNVTVLDTLVEWRESTFWRHELVQSSNVSASVRTLDTAHGDRCQMYGTTSCRKLFGCDEVLAKVVEEARQVTNRVLELDLVQNWGDNGAIEHCFQMLLSQGPREWWPQNVPHAQAMVTQGLFKCSFRAGAHICPSKSVNTGNMCV